MKTHTKKCLQNPVITLKAMALINIMELHFSKKKTCYDFPYPEMHNLVVKCRPGAKANYKISATKLSI